MKSTVRPRPGGERRGRERELAAVQCDKERQVAILEGLRQARRRPRSPSRPSTETKARSRSCPCPPRPCPPAEHGGLIVNAGRRPVGLLTRQILRYEPRGPRSPSPKRLIERRIERFDLDVVDPMQITGPLYAEPQIAARRGHVQIAAGTLHLGRRARGLPDVRVGLQFELTCVRPAPSRCAAHRIRARSRSRSGAIAARVATLR
jgi:hypothetical protein